MFLGGQTDTFRTFGPFGQLILWLLPNFTGIKRVFNLSRTPARSGNGFGLIETAHQQHATQLGALVARITL